MTQAQTKAEGLQAWRVANPEKVRAHQQSQYQKDPQKFRDAARKYAQTHRQELSAYNKAKRKARTPEQILKEQEAKRAATLKRRYGFTAADYDALLIAQDGTCAICPRTAAGERYKRLNIDHCHDSGKVRGLLCTPCNHAIGVLGDRPQGLEKALAYVKRIQ